MSLRPLLLCLFLPASLQAASWQSVEPSTLRFEGAAQGESFEGGFGQFEAQVDFDPENLAATRFEVSIDLGSADSRNSERDELLQSAEFFDVGNQQRARFEALGAQAEDGGYVSRGTLTLKGQQRAVNLRFRFTPTAEGARLEGEALLDRTDFGIGSGDWEDAEMIDHQVRVRTELTLRPAG
ncbi:YceI family protein [Pseudomarimonas salicorniae]|uniref:YceI family protein n=1 Tax=Pseudomarimonas salicorniae TaxID=2933270 RepID=A0ABT0GC02_9GAMM|nr:YceI family protein [Lysobacter sp. CAU 1642]MCK7592075.1 YceI family protein [Lysobacter sp. CAU 1642]